MFGILLLTCYNNNFSWLWPLCSGFYLFNRDILGVSDCKVIWTWIWVWFAFIITNMNILCVCITVTTQGRCYGDATAYENATSATVVLHRLIRANNMTQKLHEDYKYIVLGWFNNIQLFWKTNQVTIKNRHAIGQNIF